MKISLNVEQGWVRPQDETGLLQQTGNEERRIASADNPIQPPHSNSPLMETSSDVTLPENIRGGNEIEMSEIELRAAEPTPPQNGDGSSSLWGSSAFGLIVLCLAEPPASVAVDVRMPEQGSDHRDHSTDQSICRWASAPRPP